MDETNETKEQLIGAFGEAHDDLLIAADVAMTRGDIDTDGWGVREVLAHIAAWETEATRRIPELVAGAPDQEYDIERFNSAAIAASGETPLGRVHEDLEAAHARLTTLLDDLDVRAFRPDGAAHQWITAMTRHSRSHARALTHGHVDSTE